MLVFISVLTLIQNYKALCKKARVLTYKAGVILIIFYSLKKQRDKKKHLSVYFMAKTNSDFRNSTMYLF